MKNEKRSLTDNEIINIFAQTNKTKDLIIDSIEYVHQELFPDAYFVYTNKGKYQYQYCATQQWNRNYSQRNYHRIIKLK